MSKRGTGYWKTCESCGHDVKDHFAQPGRPCAICEVQDWRKCRNGEWLTQDTIVREVARQQRPVAELRGVALAISFKQRRACSQ